MARRGCWRVGGVGGGGTNCSSPTCWARSRISMDGVCLGGDNLDISSVVFSSIPMKASIGVSTIVRLDELGNIDRLSMDRLSDESGESGGGVKLRQKKDVKAGDRVTWCEV